MNKMKIVTKEEFETFVKQYPKKLVKNVAGYCDPPYLTYNDFDKGKWPDSEVASIVLNSDAPPHLIAPDEYRILE